MRPHTLVMGGALRRGAKAGRAYEITAPPLTTSPTTPTTPVPTQHSPSSVSPSLDATPVRQADTGNPFKFSSSAKSTQARRGPTLHRHKATPPPAAPASHPLATPNTLADAVTEDVHGTAPNVVEGDTLTFGEEPAPAHLHSPVNAEGEWVNPYTGATGAATAAPERIPLEVRVLSFRSVCMCVCVCNSCVLAYVLGVGGCVRSLSFLRSSPVPL